MTKKGSGLLCVSPDESCEVLTQKNQICFNDDKTICLDWRLILIAVALGNAVQLIFDICLELSLDTTSKPTLLDKM